MSCSWHTSSAKSSSIKRESKRKAMENEIDIYETDLAESMSIWVFGEDEHMFFQRVFLAQ